jgi:hypothetical protein
VKKLKGSEAVVFDYNEGAAVRPEALPMMSSTTPTDSTTAKGIIRVRKPSRPRASAQQSSGCKQHFSAFNYAVTEIRGSEFKRKADRGEL